MEVELLSLVVSQATVLPEEMKPRINDNSHQNQIALFFLRDNIMNFSFCPVDRC